jgi:hypothetical protein
VQNVTAAACTTGSWAQKWKCGWDQPVNTTAASHAGSAVGKAAPIIIGIIIVLLLLAAWNRSRNRSAAPASK